MTDHFADVARTAKLIDQSRTTAYLRVVAGERWYCVHTQPRREAVAELHLAMQNYPLFLPQVIKTVRHARKLRTVKAALFPRYLFIRLDVDRDRWRSVNGTPGVTRLVTTYDRPEPVPEGIVEAFLEAREPTGVVRFDFGLQAGQKVRVLAGPFADAIGSLERLDDNGRVRVLLDIMGGQVPAHLHAAALAPAA